MALPSRRSLGATLGICLLLHAVSFTQEVLVIAFFCSRQQWAALLPVATAFFVIGLICARAAWDCKLGAYGLLPLRDKPKLLACPLALLFGWGQLVIVVLAVQDYRDKVGSPDAIEEELPSRPSRRSGRDGDEVASRRDCTFQWPGAAQASRPWRAHGGTSRFHCKAADGICEAFVFGAVLETEYWWLNWPPSDPIFRSGSPWDLHFLQIMITLAFVSAACSVLELDNAVSDAARKQMQERCWYVPMHWLLRATEIGTRVSLHSIFMVLMRKHPLFWVPLSASFLYTLVCISLLAGVDRIRGWPSFRFLLKLLVSTLCVLADLFLFIDHPQERHASRSISFWLLVRNVAEAVILPVLVWMQVSAGNPEVLDAAGVLSFLGFGDEDDGHPYHSLHGKAFGMIIGCVFAYFFLRLALPRTLPQPFWDLYDACREGRYEEVQRALGASAGPDIDREDVAGYTPLMLAALHGHENICLLLLFHGARADARGHGEGNPWLAHCCGSWAGPATLSWTALHLCARGGSSQHAQILQYLLRSSSGNAKMKDALGNTPLHVAVQYGNVMLVREVANEFPADWFTEKNNAGRLPEDLAVTEAIAVQVQGEASAAMARSKPLLPASGSLAMGGLLEPRTVRSVPLPSIPAPPDEPDGWVIKSVRVRSYGRESVTGLCSFVLSQGTGLLSGLLNGPLPPLPEEPARQPSISEMRLRRSNSDPGVTSPFGTLDALATGSGFVANTVRLEELEPCDRFSGLPLLESGDQAAGDMEAWFKPPVEAFVGGGTYGKVYRARRRPAAGGDESSFAVKCIVKRSRAADRESEVSERVRQRPHPCVVSIHDVVDLPARALIFVAMEFCPGPDPAVGHDLCSAVKYFAASTAEGIMPEDNARTLFAEVFLGLEHLHVRMRSLLRDLKHHNVGLDAAGHAKLLDFGLGRLDLYAPNAAWSFGAPPGSLGWAAPEIFLNRPYTFHCDFYSLGVLLWVMSTGGISFSSHPPAGAHGISFKRHSEDHRMFRSCLEHPRHHNTRPVDHGPARDLVWILTSEKPARRGNHFSLRAHPYMAKAELPDVGASAKEVAAWVASRPGLASSVPAPPASMHAALPPLAAAEPLGPPAGP